MMVTAIRKICIFALGIVIPSACKRATASDTVESAYLALTKSDYHGFLGFLTPGELSSLRISEQTAEKVTARAWGEFATLKHDKYTLADNSAIGSCDLRLLMVTKRGEDFPFMMTAQADGGKYYLQEGISSLVILGMLANSDSTLAKKVRLYRAVKDNYLDYDKQGMHGLVLDGKYMSWDDYLVWLRARSEKK